MSALWKETVPGGAMWSHVLRRGTALRLTDVEGGANVGALFFNYENVLERYNMADTLKAQHIARLTAGCALYSDMGRVLCSIIEDTCGWHDPIGGCSNAALMRARYGESNYQTHRNACVRNGRDCFLTELGKYGLGPRDLVANVNFFSQVRVSETGRMEYVMGNSKPGDFVGLRAEMNMLIVLNTCPHPLNPSPKYSPKPILLAIRAASPAGPDDPCRLACPENERGFTLTERCFL